MYNIYLKGENESITLNDREGKSIDDTFCSSDIPKDTILMVGNSHIRKGDIRKIRFFPETDGDENVRSSITDYLAGHNEAIKMTPEDRGKRLSLFKFLFYCKYGTEPSNEALEEASAAQKLFFEQNPKRIWPNGETLTAIIEKHRPEDATIPDSFRVAGLRSVEQAILQDIEEEKRI